MTPTPLIDTLILKQRLHDYSMQRFGQDIFIRSRRKELVFERHNAMYVLKQHTPLSLSQIGYVCSNGKVFDHATVMHAIKKVEDDNLIYADRQTSIDEWKLAIQNQRKRNESVNIWTNILFEIIGKFENNNAPFHSLINKIQSTLLMADAEREVWNRIREIVVKNLAKQ